MKVVSFDDTVALELNSHAVCPRADYSDSRLETEVLKVKYWRRILEKKGRNI